MTAAALALALAVLVRPVDSRRRARRVLTKRARRLTFSVPALALLASVTAALTWAPTVGMAIGVLSATLLVRRSMTQRRRHRSTHSAALHGALDVLVGELRVGAHPVAAMDTAARESAGPVAQSLAAVAARARLGADVATGLRDQGRRSPVRSHWQRLAVCWALAQTHGLAIATLMQAAQRDITERERFRGRVEAAMAGARATAVILAALPLLGILLGHAIGAAPLRFLFSGGIGGWLLVVGSALICCGLLWSDRITHAVLT